MLRFKSYDIYKYNYLSFSQELNYKLPDHSFCTQKKIQINNIIKY